MNCSFLCAQAQVPLTVLTAGLEEGRPLDEGTDLTDIRKHKAKGQENPVQPVRL